MIKNQDIICLSFTDWDREMPSNRYHILTRFAKNNRVFLFERQIYPLWRDKHRFFKFLSVRRKDGLYIIEPGFYTPLGFLNGLVYWLYLKIIIARYHIKKPIFWFYNYRLTSILKLKHVLSCYHCTEIYSETWRTKKETSRKKVEKIKRQEKKLAKNVDLIFACSDYLAAKLKKINPATFSTPNAAEYSFYRKAQKPKVNKFGLEPVLGYCGNIADYKINIPLLIKLSQNFPKCRIVLVGPVIGQSRTMEKLKKQKNVLFLGKKEVGSLPGIIREFDVCLMPYNTEKWNLFAGQPLKLYEYIASGKPIVSVNFDCLKDLTDIVYVAKNDQEFIAQVRKALKEKGNNLRLKRIKIAQQNTWDERFNLMNDKMEERLK